MALRVSIVFGPDARPGGEATASSAGIAPVQPLRWSTIRPSTIGIIARYLIAFALAATIIEHAEAQAHWGRRWSASQAYAAVGSAGAAAALLGLVLLPLWAARTRGRIAMIGDCLWFAAGLAGLLGHFMVVRFL